MKIGLFARLIGSVAAATIVANLLVTASTLYWGLTRSESHWQARKSVSDGVVHETIQSLVEAGNLNRLESLLSEFYSLNGTFELRLVSTEGHIIFAKRLPTETRAPQWFLDSLSSFSFGQPEQRTTQVQIAGPDTSGQNTSETYLISTRSLPIPFINGLWDILVAQLIVISASGSLIVLITLLLMGKSLRPLKLLRLAAAQVGYGNFSVRLPSDTGHPDLDSTFKSFNAMANQVDGLVSSLAERENTLGTLFETTPIGIQQVDLDGNTIFMNPAMQSLSGVSGLEDFTFIDHIHPEDREIIRDHWRSVMKTGQHYDIRFRFMIEGGRTRWVKCSTATLTDEQDQPRAVIAFITDISHEVSLQQQTDRVSSFYLTLSRINSIIIHSETAEDLYPQLCRTFVEIGGFNQASVGMADFQAKQVNLNAVQRIGSATGPIEEASCQLSLIGPGSENITSQSLINNTAYTANDYRNDTRFGDVHQQQLEQYNIRSTATVLFTCFDETVAVLALSSNERGAFTEDIINYIKKVGEDVSHALENFRREEQRQQALGLAQSIQDRLHTTLRSIGDAVVVTDQYGCITLMNPVAEQLIDWPEANARGLNVQEVFGVRTAAGDDQLARGMAQALNGEIADKHTEQLFLHTTEGAQVPIDDSIAPIFAEVSGKAPPMVNGVVLVLHDQSKDFAIRHKLKESEERFSTLVENVPIGIFVSDLTRNLSYANSEIRRVTGIANKNISVDELEKTIHPDDMPIIRSVMRRALMQKRTQMTGFYRYIPQDGKTVWAKMRLTPTFDEQGKYSGFLGGVLDVTNEREHLMKAEALSTLYATLSKVNYQVVHAPDEETLLSDACKTIAEVPDFNFLTVYQQTSNRAIYKQILVYGDEEYYEEPHRTIDVRELQEDEKVMSPMLHGLTQPLIFNDCENDERLSDRITQLYLNKQVRSIALIPINVSQQPYGCIAIYSAKPNLFNTEIVELLSEVSNVLSFAIGKFKVAYQQRQAEEALAVNEQRLRLGLSATKTGMFEYAFANESMVLDQTVCELLSFKAGPGEYPASKILSWLPERVRQGFGLQVDSARRQLRSSGSFTQEFFITDEDNKDKWVNVFGGVTETDELTGEPTRLVGFISDISDLKAREARETLAATVFDNSGEAILIIDADEKIVMVNQVFCDTYGYTADEVVGKTPEILRSPDKYRAGQYQSIMKGLETQGRWQGELWRRRKNGEDYPALTCVSNVRDSQGRVYHTVIQEIDISEQKAAEQRISKLAYHDSLTNLPNRSLLRDRGEQAIVTAEREGHSLALIFLDLDHFKNINDSLGHAVGDKLLQEISRRLLDCVRRADTVGRLGGDEFLILLNEINADGAAHVAQKILESCIKPCSLNDHTLSVTPSVGIAMYPRDGDDYDELLKKADTAMYRAKDEGRNAFRFFTPEMNRVVFQRLMLESSLRKAIDNQEFILHYQPKYCIHDMKLIGVEALLRWHQPGLGMVSPAEFIPVAEESGLVTEIGEWVINEACRQGKEWLDQGLSDFKIAVNFSTRQFANRNVEQVVQGALERWQLPGKALEIEITESLLAQDMEYIYQSLSALKQRGVSISIDDFGTGYSSLSYLKRFPIDRLKIDRSFVSDLASDADDRAIASAVITMGHSLGMRVIAEGIETQEHLDILRDMNCDEGQGYYLGRPLSAHELNKVLFNSRLPDVSDG